MKPKPPEPGTTKEETEEEIVLPLIRLRLHGNILAMSLTGIGLSTLCLFLLTGLAGSVWLFLLYPLLIAILLISLGALAIFLIRRL